MSWPLAGGTTVASDFHPRTCFTTRYATHFAVPWWPVTVALMLEAEPKPEPRLEAGEALRDTASRSRLPDNNFGWGVIDVVAAMDYLAPTIVHIPLADNEGGIGAYPVTATIYCDPRAGCRAVPGWPGGRRRMPGRWRAWHRGRKRLHRLHPAPVPVRVPTSSTTWWPPTAPGWPPVSPPSAPAARRFSFRVGRRHDPAGGGARHLADQLQADLAACRDRLGQTIRKLTASSSLSRPIPGTATGPST